MPHAIEHEVCLELAPKIRRVTQNNPGMFPGPGTNTHLIGGDTVLVLDPGEDSEEHFEAVSAAIGEGKVAGILPTHRHGDHWPLAPRLSERYGAPILAYGDQGPFRVDRSLVDGETIRVGPDELRVLFTPGHASDHVSVVFSAASALFTGDHVMGWSTTIIGPPDGNLNDYMNSLHKLREAVVAEQIETLYPAHGEALEDPLGRIDELAAHRQARTDQALAILAEGPASIPAMVRVMYADVDPRLHPAAERSLLAHLLALVEDERVAQTGDDPQAATYGLRKP